MMPHLLGERRRIELLLDRMEQQPEERTDDRPAILTVHAGAGGTEAHDWAGMLLGMYAGWARRQSRRVEMMDLDHAPRVGMRSATLEIGGPQAFRLLAPEAGVHRMMRMSPYDPQGRRHTSRARVVVVPAPDPEANDTEIQPADLEWSFFRASGPGGQHVQKVDTAVRLRHRPTGTVVTCQTERSQRQNRDYALRLLQARLLEQQDREERESRERQPEAGWGNRIRSYSLQPRRYVHDHRTGHREQDVQRVLEGHIDGLIEARPAQLGKDSRRDMTAGESLPEPME